MACPITYSSDPSNQILLLQDSLSDKKVEQSHVKDCKPSSETKRDKFSEPPSEYSSLNSKRGAPSSASNLIEGTLESSTTCGGKAFQKGFEANRESIYSQTKVSYPLMTSHEFARNFISINVAIPVD